MENATKTFGNSNAIQSDSEIYTKFSELSIKRGRMPEFVYHEWLIKLDYEGRFRPKGNIEQVRSQYKLLKQKIMELDLKSGYTKAKLHRTIQETSLSPLKVKENIAENVSDSPQIDNIMEITEDVSTSVATTSAHNSNDSSGDITSLPVADLTSLKRPKLYEEEVSEISKKLCTERSEEIQSSLQSKLGSEFNYKDINSNLKQNLEAFLNVPPLQLSSYLKSVGLIKSTIKDRNDAVLVSNDNSSVNDKLDTYLSSDPLELSCDIEFPDEEIMKDIFNVGSQDDNTIILDYMKSTEFYHKDVPQLIREEFNSPEFFKTFQSNFLDLFKMADYFLHPDIAKLINDK